MLVGSIFFVIFYFHDVSTKQNVGKRALLINLVPDIRMIAFEEKTKDQDSEETKQPLKILDKFQTLHDRFLLRMIGIRLEWILESKLESK